MGLWKGSEEAALEVPWEAFLCLAEKNVYSLAFGQNPQQTFLNGLIERYELALRLNYLLFL